LILIEKYTKVVYNKVQKTWTKIKGSEELRISGINDRQKELKLIVNFKNEDILKISLDLFSN
jgi:hypothetical protein